VPDLTKPLHESSSLDIEARRLIFIAGSRYHLDTPLLAPPAAAGSKPTLDTKPVGGTKFLPTTVDPDSAVAEWSVKDREVVIAIKWASVAARERDKETEGEAWREKRDSKEGRRGRAQEVDTTRPFINFQGDYQGGCHVE